MNTHDAKELSCMCCQHQLTSHPLSGLWDIGRCHPEPWCTHLCTAQQILEVLVLDYQRCLERFVVQTYHAHQGMKLCSHSTAHAASDQHNATTTVQLASMMSDLCNTYISSHTDSTIHYHAYQLLLQLKHVHQPGAALHSQHAARLSPAIPPMSMYILSYVPVGLRDFSLSMSNPSTTSKRQ